ncbi:hypothetical protein LIER_40684 [Lithospermum erythrorhizon]|uniref:Uncharacterized protein n=1 Tax=Lithospermum erythrorhizon TaxID=34254 RepID=A0AAV3QY11_LITER
MLSKAAGLTSVYNSLCSAERQFYQSKARMWWYKDRGDVSTSFFHKNISLHQAKNKIMHIHNNDCILIEDYDEVKRVVSGFL